MASISQRVAIAIALGLVGRASCLRVGTLRAPSRLSVMTQMRVQAETKQLAAALAMFAAAHLGGLQPAFADGSTETFKFPPIDSKKVDRCKFVSSAMGQANAARDSLYDLRECKMDKMSAGGFDISGALLASGSFKGTDFKEAQLSKASAVSVLHCVAFRAPTAKALSPLAAEHHHNIMARILHRHPPSAFLLALTGVRPGSHL